MDGALVIDKPAGITSHAAVVAVRRLLSEPRVGHLGTLDPLASGVLVLLLGRATRLARFYLDRDKSYIGVIRLGFATTTYDREGQATSPDCAPALVESELRALFREFLGTRLQEPPPYSAKKISGVPAYRLARKGKLVTLQAAPVTIHELELLAVEGPLVRFRTRVSSGTYVRSLAHELGQRLQVGGHLTELRRTAVGEFDESMAVPLAVLQHEVGGPSAAVDSSQGIASAKPQDSLLTGASAPEVTPAGRPASRDDAARPLLIPMQDLLPDLPSIPLSDEQTLRAAHGRDIEIEADREFVRLLDRQGRLVAIAERVNANLLHPAVVVRTVSESERERPDKVVPRSEARRDLDFF